jgi:cytochrome c553
LQADWSSIFLAWQKSVEKRPEPVCGVKFKAMGGTAMTASGAALAAAVVTILLSRAGQAADISRHRFQMGAFHAKIQYCIECHGPSGRGYRGAYPIPRLAGQQVQYLENQFKALSEHSRDNPVSKKFMVPVINSVAPDMQTAIAEHFSALKARPAADGPRNLVAQGKKLFEEGDPDNNLPACSACHGTDGKGSDTVPSLAGQMYSYTVTQLKGWSKGYRSKDPMTPENPNTMRPIAETMTKEQIAAVAAFVSRLD